VCRLTGGWFWSSSSNANNPSNAWNVNFNNGNVNNNNKNNANQVRLVRGGKGQGECLLVRARLSGYRQCRRRKRGTAKAQRYEQLLLDRLVDTTQALQERSYAPSRSLCFVARQPKAREIHAADFSDRVMHHVLVPRLEALFEPDLAVALAGAPWLGRWRAARVEPRAGLAPGLSWPLSQLKGLGRSLTSGLASLCLYRRRGLSVRRHEAARAAFPLYRRCAGTTTDPMNQRG